MAILTVLYPQPSDDKQFEGDYGRHIDMLHEKTGLPKSEKPYTITKFLTTPDGKPPYYQQFSMPFPSLQALMDLLATDGMKEVAADAHRISSGGAPVILIGEDR